MTIDKVLIDLNTIKDKSLRCDKAMDILKYMSLEKVRADVVHSVVSNLIKYKEVNYEV